MNTSGILPFEPTPADLPTLQAATDLGDAAKKVVAAVRGVPAMGTA